MNYNDNPFTWTDGGMDVDSGVVSFDMRADDDNDTVISVDNLATPVDIYLPVNTSQLDLSYFTQALVTKDATSLVSVQTGGGTNVAIKVVVRVTELSEFETLLLTRCSLSTLTCSAHDVSENDTVALEFYKDVSSLGGADLTDTENVLVVTFNTTIQIR